MRRILVGSTAFLAFAGTVLVLPVYAAPVPPAHPVKASVQQLALGSVTDPSATAVVTADGEPLPGGVTQAQATGVATTPTSSAQTTQASATEPSAPQASTTEPSATEHSATQPSTSQPSGASGSEGASAGAASTAASPSPSSATVPGQDVPTSGDEVPGVPALTVSQPDTAKFETVGVTWSQDDVTKVAVQLRVKHKDGRWGPWTSLQQDDVSESSGPVGDGKGIRGGTAPYFTGDGYGVQAIVQGDGGVVPRDVKVALIDPGTSAADQLTVPTAKDKANAAGLMPPVFSRAQWGADESIRTWDPEYAPTIKAVALHHTDDTNNYTADQVPAMIRAIYTFHAVTRGWGDIGYNVLVDKFGRLFEGRYGGLASTVIGAHTGGFNYDTFGISMIGDYDLVEPPAAMLNAISSFIAWKFGLYGVAPYGTTVLTSAGGGTAKYPAGQAVTLPTIFGHRDTGTTICPGKYGYARLPDIRNMVAAKMAPPAGSPVGNLEIASLSGTVVSLRGWAFDPDDGSIPLDARIQVDGQDVTTLSANQLRYDVGAAYPQAGIAHGFAGSVDIGTGDHTLCVILVNAPPNGTDNTLSCRMFSVPPASRNPLGNVDGVIVSGRSISLTGWAFDPDVPTTPLSVHIYVNGQWGAAVTADVARPDVARVYPTAGFSHGFTWSMQATQPGNYQICAYGINQGAGSANPTLACRTVTVSAAPWNPIGNLDSASVTGPYVRLFGWALDRDTPTSPTAVHVYVDGAWRAAFNADATRADVGGAYPGFGNQHGIDFSIGVPGGKHNVCLYLINSGYGVTNPLLACRTVSVDPSAWNPFGNVDGAVVSGGAATVTGWAIDPDAPSAAVVVHVYVDGNWRTSTTATVSRPDVAVAYPGAGPAHGFSIPVSVGRGRHQVCVYAINQGLGTTNPLVACRTVTS